MASGGGAGAVAMSERRRPLLGDFPDGAPGGGGGGNDAYASAQSQDSDDDLGRYDAGFPLPDMALLASQQLALSRQLCELAAGLGSEEDVVDG